jgi:hypothetical protein
LVKDKNPKRFLKTTYATHRLEDCEKLICLLEELNGIKKPANHYFESFKTQGRKSRPIGTK